MALSFSLGDLGIGQGGGGVDLNDALSAKTPQNSNVFSKPFGDKTVWNVNAPGSTSGSTTGTNTTTTNTNNTSTNTNTSSRAVCVAFLFDPNKTWSSQHIMASITTDWPAAIRHALAKQLLPAHLVVPDGGVHDVRKSIWQALTASLPAKALEQYLLSHPQKLDEVADMVEKEVVADFNEEEALTEALRTRDFRFAFAVAIDAFPASLNNSGGARSRGGGAGASFDFDLGNGNGSAVNLGERKGVLTFYIEGQQNPTPISQVDALGTAAAGGDGGNEADLDDQEDQQVPIGEPQDTLDEPAGSTTGGATSSSSSSSDEEDIENGAQRGKPNKKRNSKNHPRSSLRQLRKVASGTMRSLSAKAAKKAAKENKREVCVCSALMAGEAMHNQCLWPIVVV